MSNYVVYEPDAHALTIRDNGTGFVVAVFTRVPRLDYCNDGTVWFNGSCYIRNVTEVIVHDSHYENQHTFAIDDFEGASTVTFRGATE